ncbi:hypothetical protein VHEMI04431 [[Torrubiella] hemipterigena]|uniref:Fungal STAND N-terminal Goodbye domain-containing protein n=1 Tax=[Torrubiella] hemipterigena TaxID=1531966 RepID=A0A0A1SV81_9HYPO|nr:hypothetical protein VHEMI04431 [[Torrubiella] hemipterigena]
MSQSEIIGDNSPNLMLMWQEAIVNYVRITGNKNGITIRRTASISDILAELDQKRESFNHKRHDGSKWDRFRGLIRDSLAPIQALSDIAAQASKAVFPPSEAIFSAVRYLITTANNVSGDYDKLDEFFIDVNSYLTGIEMWEHQIPLVLGLNSAITTVFSSILLLCGTYTKYIQKKRVVKAFQSLLSGEDKELKEAHRQFQKAVQRGRDIVQNATLSSATQTYENTREVRGNFQRAFSSLDRIEQTIYSSTQGANNINRYLDSQERDSTLDWLSTFDFRKQQRDIFSKYCDNTGQWLLNAGPFQKWVYSRQPSTLWCPGDRMAINPRILYISLIFFSW